MNNFSTLTKEELDKLEQRYGNAFYKAYKSEILEELDRQEKMDKLLESANKRQDTNRYGHLLDKYIK